METCSKNDILSESEMESHPVVERNTKSPKGTVTESKSQSLRRTETVNERESFTRIVDDSIVEKPSGSNGISGTLSEMQSSTGTSSESETESSPTVVSEMSKTESLPTVAPESESKSSPTVIPESETESSPTVDSESETESLLTVDPESEINAPFVTLAGSNMETYTKNDILSESKIESLPVAERDMESSKGTVTESESQSLRRTETVNERESSTRTVDKSIEEKPSGLNVLSETLSEMQSSTETSTDSETESSTTVVPERSETESLPTVAPESESKSSPTVALESETKSLPTVAPENESKSSPTVDSESETESLPTVDPESEINTLFVTLAGSNMEPYTKNDILSESKMESLPVAERNTESRKGTVTDSESQSLRRTETVNERESSTRIVDESIVEKPSGSNVLSGTLSEMQSSGTSTESETESLSTVVPERSKTESLTTVVPERCETESLPTVAPEIEINTPFVTLAGGNMETYSKNDILSESEMEALPVAERDTESPKGTAVTQSESQSLRRTETVNERESFTRTVDESIVEKPSGSNVLSGTLSEMQSSTGTSSKSETESSPTVVPERSETESLPTVDPESETKSSLPLETGREMENLTGIELEGNEKSNRSMNETKNYEICIYPVAESETESIPTGTAPKRATELSSTRTAPKKGTELSSIGTVPKRATESSTGTVPKRATESSTGTVPKRATESSTGTVPKRATGSSTGTVPKRTTELFSIRTVPKKATELSSTRTAPKRAIELSSTRTAPKRATELSSTRTAPKRATELSSSRTAPKRATELSSSRTAPKRATELSSTRNVLKNATELSFFRTASKKATESSSTLTKKAIEPSLTKTIELESNETTTTGTCTESDTEIFSDIELGSNIRFNRSIDETIHEKCMDITSECNITRTSTTKRITQSCKKNISSEQENYEHENYYDNDSLIWSENWTPDYPFKIGFLGLKQRKKFDFTELDEYKFAEPKYFQDFYEETIDHIKEIKSWETKFEGLKSNFERARFVMKLGTCKNLELCKPDSGKSEFTALKSEKSFDDSFIRGYYEEALDHISRSLKFTHGLDFSMLRKRYTKRAALLLKMEKYKEAFKDARLGLAYYGEVDESLWKAYEILGCCYTQQCLFEKARYCFQTALNVLIKSDLDREEKYMTEMRINSVYFLIKGKIRSPGSQRFKHDVEEELPRVTKGPNQKFESASSLVEYRRIIEGRGLYAAKNIKPGDILIVEEPIACALQFINYCCICFKHVLNPIPCINCTDVWFCGEKCWRASIYDVHHEHECNIMPLLYDAHNEQMTMLTYRALISWPWKNLKASLPLIKTNQYDAVESNQFYPGIDFKDKNRQIYKSSQISWLLTNGHSRTYCDKLKKSLASVYILECLKAGEYFGDDPPTRKEEIKLVSIALKYMQSAACNSYEVTEYATGRVKDVMQSKNEKVEFELIQSGSKKVQSELVISGSVNVKSNVLKSLGNALYQVVSLINHSCFPNTFCYYINNVCVVRAIQYIKKGEQLFNSYGTIYETASKENRSRFLSYKYHFNCECKACVNNWSPKNVLKIPCPEPNCQYFIKFNFDKFTGCLRHGSDTKKISALISDIQSKLNDLRTAKTLVLNGERDRATEFLKYFLAFLNRVTRPPSEIYSVCQDALKRCFLLEGNKV